MATRWTVPANTTPTFKAMKMYRNYDGAKSTFGDTSVSASVPNPDNLSAFAALRASDGAMTVMVIDKVLSGTTSVNLNLAHFTASGTAKVYRLTASNAIKALPNKIWSGGTLSDTEPAQSITLYVLPK
jgi:alpha-L-arabinofuranosidase